MGCFGVCFEEEGKELTVFKISKVVQLKYDFNSG